MNTLTLVGLDSLMERTEGSPCVRIGLIDGPVAMSHPDLAHRSIQDVPGRAAGACARATSAACRHGTFVAGVLSGRRGSLAPAVAPACALLVRPVFHEPNGATDGSLPGTTPEQLAEAIVDCVTAGATVLNLSLALAPLATGGVRHLQHALDHAVQRGALIVAAAGNQATLGHSIITGHPGVIPVVACDDRGYPMHESNLGRSIGRQGLRAPGKAITSLGSEGTPLTLGGTSVATPFVTGAIALLWSEFPGASAAQVRAAIVDVGGARRTVVPPLLNASAAYEVMCRRRHASPSNPLRGPARGN